MDWLVPLADLDYGPEEDAAVLSVLHSKWLTMGAVTQQFEQAFAALHGVKYAFALSNATQALHLACVALGIGPGDEVIVPSLTFVATANAVLYTGAEVRFADIIGPDELTIDPAEIDRLAKPTTKAVIAMHYAGYPCRMPEILAAAQRCHLAVIEDAAHAPGASLAGKSLGAWGDVGCFSFFSNKNLSTGEGGMLVTNSDAVATEIRLLRSHGMTSLTYDRHQGHAHSYDVVRLGYNDRIDEIRSALGLAQLAKLALNNARRAELTALYRALLAPTGLTVPFASTPGAPSYHLLPALLPDNLVQTHDHASPVQTQNLASLVQTQNLASLVQTHNDASLPFTRSSFMDALKTARIQSSIHYPPIHTFTYYRQRYGEISLPRTESAAARELTLPLYPTMGEDKVRQVVAAITNLIPA